MVALGALEACKIGDITTLKNIASVNQDIVDSNGASCLHYAARGGSVGVVEYLIREKGFTASHRSNTGATALHDAAAKGNTAIVKWLIENTDLQVGEQDSAGATALHLAARFGHILTVEWLLDEANASAAARTASDALPLHFAVVGGDMNCVKILVDENPRLINMQMNNGTTPVYLASQTGHFDILKFLVSKNGATKILAYDAMSCLHAAAQNGHLDIVKWLVKEEKCNPNDRDFDGATPLHYAASRGHADIVLWMLKEGGAKITLDNIGGSPLHNAAELGEIETVIALLKAGCDVALVDNEGLTAAELSDKCGQTEAAALIRGEITADQALVRTKTGSRSLKPPPNHLRSPHLNFSPPDHLRSPHLSFPPPPPFPPENTESSTNTYSSRSTSPPLPPPPTSPPFSTPPTTGSTISPPTPLSEAEDEITVLDSSFGLHHSQSGKDIVIARETIKRTPSQMSVDSTASNFGIFEHQQGPVVHIVKADIHHTPLHILSNSHPVKSSSSSGTGSNNTSRVGPMSTSGSGTSLTQSSGVSNGALRQETVTSNSRPGVVNIYSKQGKTASIKSRPETQPASHWESGSNHSLNSSSTQGHTPSSVTTSNTSLSSSGSITSTQEESNSEKKLKKPYYTTQYRQDFNTVSKTKFAQVKALFQQGVADPIYICPDSGEVCTKEEHQTYTGKQTPGQHSFKMNHEDSDHVPPPPPPPAVEKTEHPLPNGGTAVPNGDSKSVVSIHGGHVTIISTGGKSDDVINRTVANKSAPGPVSSGKVVSSGHSDNVSALMKELSLRRPASQINGNVTPTTQPLPNGNTLNHSDQVALSRPVSVHTSVDVASEMSDKSKIYSRSSSSSSASSQPHSPVAITNKHNLIADIQSAVSGSSNLSLRRAKSRGEGVSMVYQSKKSAAASDVQNDHRPLSGQFDPKNFLDQIEKVDSSGLVIPEWRRQVLAKHAAEKAQKEYEEKKLVEDYEERFKNVPAWKRAIIEKKEAQAKEEAAALKK